MTTDELRDLIGLKPSTDTTTELWYTLLQRTI
jgi:hypothetical protein